ncbi:hypothetical protein [Streptosporangium lutulentum]|uniref:hypothetical protein n=1 Tax=Streptosporangium lutulentum TaxID=1461250 RepID=UPI00360B2649
MSAIDPDSLYPRLPSKSPRVSWWRMPFTADTWRRTLYALLVLPVAIVFATPWVVRGITHAQGSLLRRMPGTADRGPAARTPSV